MPMIIGEVRRYLRDNSTIRVSRSVRDLAYKALSAREQLSRSMTQEPTVEQITEYLQKNGSTCTREEVVEALEAIVDPLSLFDPVYGSGADGGDTLYVMDQVRDTESSDEIWMENIALREAMRKLNPREHEIIRLRFFEGRTQMEIADEIGISQAQVSRLEKGAVEQLRKQM